MNIPEILEELRRLEYPSLLPDHDPDIERYYYLRSRGYAREAMIIYQNRLKIRYPDEKFRTILMRCYRNRDSSYRKLLALGYRNLGYRILERVKKIIAYIAKKADAYNERDAYSTIKAAEDILVVLPGDRYEAAAGIERYLRYAQALNFYQLAMGRAAVLINAYLSQSLSVVEEERNRREKARRLAQAQNLQRIRQREWEGSARQRSRTPPKNIRLNMESIVFSPEDLARIEIPRNLSKIEDQTLAYCIKYWNLIFDTVFERILFLYSRKYGTKNYDVFVTIRRGRMNKHRDDEILASVMSLLVRGYYYSIRGDKYLQRQWNVIKSSLEQNRPASASAPAETRTEQRSDTALQAPAAQVSESPPSRARASAVRARVKAAMNTVSGKKSSARKKDALENSSRKNKKALLADKDKPEDGAPEAAVKRMNVMNQKNRVAVATLSPSARIKSRLPRTVTPNIAEGSVSDRLRQLSGRSYDLYQDRFLTQVRPAIRKILNAGRGLFFKVPEEAENLIYNFLKEHYADPYMNWGDSEERKALAAMGFELESLIPIIDDCYRWL
jgi:hypothetical protein